jgi:hypothetical protein
MCILLALPLVTACSTPPTDRMNSSIQNECVKIADRNERQNCLEVAAFGARQ